MANVFVYLSHVAVWIPDQLLAFLVEFRVPRSIEREKIRIERERSHVALNLKLMTP